MKRTLKKFSFLISLSILFISFIFFLHVGTANIPPSKILTLILNNIIFQSASTTTESMILWEIRVPRILLAILVGSSLAVAGACYQTLFKNPLADPFILGVSSGAALGAAIAIILKQSTYISIFAFMGGIIAIFLVYYLGGGFNAHFDNNHLLLAGVALGSLLNALLSTLMVLASQQITEIMFWLLGSLNNPPNNLVNMVSVVILLFFLIYAFARDLDLLTAGDEHAQYLGVDVKKVRLILITCTTLLTAMVVSVSGIIGFIGLIIPHLLRNIIGPMHKTLLPQCAIWGGIVLLWSDGITRFSTDLASIPVGVITALFGSPFFLYILSKRGRHHA